MLTDIINRPTVNGQVKLYGLQVLQRLTETPNIISNCPVNILI
jgi:hypothetical protein